MRRDMNAINVKFEVDGPFFAQPRLNAKLIILIA